jgi:hypothetical protein
VLAHTLDEVADLLASGGACTTSALYTRESDQAVPPTCLQLYTNVISAAVVSAAVRAGFFVFGSEFKLARRALEDRALLNLELGGPAREPSGEDVGGRIVLDLAAGSDQHLVVGKRSIKTVRSVGGSADARGEPYRLTVNRAFAQSWAAILRDKGCVEWFGFRAVRAAYAALHARRPRPWEAGGDDPSAPSVLSIELWGGEAGDELVSAEVGCI